MNSQKARRVALACAFFAVAAWAQSPPPAPASAASAALSTAPAGATPYKVTGGYFVDDFTLTGFRTWRAAACDRCHGANQQGLVGPSLIDSLKTLGKADFVTTLTNGRLEKGMPSWSANPAVMGNMDALYAYLKGRSDGAITRAHVEPMAQAGAASAASQ